MRTGDDLKEKRRWFGLSLVFLLVMFSLTACKTSSEYDIRGSWEYIRIASDGNVYDSGTITFSGGAYLKINTNNLAFFCSKDHKEKLMVSL